MPLKSIPADTATLKRFIKFLFVGLVNTRFGYGVYALLVIFGTHFVIDRWHLARYVAWVKNRPWPGSAPWRECTQTGFHPDTPPWLAGWLVIVIDNILHIAINGLAITYIG